MLGKSMQRFVALAIGVALFLTSTLALAGDVHVRGHYRNGKWIAPHYRSSPDGNFYNNWSTYGNVNPYTGKPGTRRTPPAGYNGPGPDSYASSSSSSYDGDYSMPQPEKYVMVWRRGQRVAVPMSQVTEADLDLGKREREPATRSPISRSPTGATRADWAVRKALADELTQAGIKTNWISHSRPQLEDMLVANGLR